MAEAVAEVHPGSAQMPVVVPESLQEIRIATVLNGGVSLAVWMSGVTLELHHLALSAQQIDRWRPYQQVLDLLGATVRIDVIAGTSAGGINGAFLALAQAHRRDLTLLRDLWTNCGALEDLLRPATQKQPPSLLRGDEYFLPQVQAALAATVSDVGNPQLGTGELPHTPIELILTGTLWQGRESSFTDDMGVSIAERDYDALFRFSRGTDPDVAGDLTDVASVIPQLAHAARCTSSFPAAFEPHRVEMLPGRAGATSWASTAGQANFSTGQYVIDGGILLNKPIRPALDAIYQQTGHRQVRRVLTYVVPDPGEAPAAQPPTVPPPATPATEPVPVAGEVLLGVLTRLRSTDSVSRELSEIRERNASVRARRRSRSLLSRALFETAELSDALWEGYREERIRTAASTVAPLIAAGQPARSAAAPGAGAAGSAWSEQEIEAGLLRYARQQGGGFGFVPSGPLADAVTQREQDWHWGQTTVSRLADMTVDFLKRVVWSARFNTSDQSAIVKCRTEVADVIRTINADSQSLHRFWSTVAQGVPAQGAYQGIAPIVARAGKPNESASNLDALDQWLAAVVPAWEAVPPYGLDPASAGPADRGERRRTGMYRQAHRLASILEEYRADLQRVIDNPDPAMGVGTDDLKELADLHRWLFARERAEGVLEQMLRLDVVQFATSGAAPQAEQEVELVQVSGSDPSAITGMQLHHFGAFYRASWRVNDWIAGRLDGAKQIMRLLLSPERLRQRGLAADELLEHLRRIAVPDTSPFHDYLAANWAARQTTYREELTRVMSPGGGGAFDSIAEALALPLRLQTLVDDLPALAGAIRDEGTDAMPGSIAWLGRYDAMLAAAPAPRSAGSPCAGLSATDLWTLRTLMSEIGSQQITADIGSDTFARTAAHAAVITAGAVGSPPKIGKIKAVRFLFSSLRGYAALVWAMVSYLTRGSVVGTRMVELAVAVGGALLAVTLLVPGIPIGLTLAGVITLLAGFTATALRTKNGAWFGGRVAAAIVLLAAWLAYLIWRDVDVNGWNHSTTLSSLIKGGVGLVIVLLGSWIARTKATLREGLIIGGIIAAGVAALLVVLLV
jgi:patatin-related protein